MIVVMVMVTTMGMMTWWENDVDDDYALHRLDGGIACQPSNAVLMHKNNWYRLMFMIVFDQNLAHVCNNLVKYLAHPIQLE